MFRCNTLFLLSFIASAAVQAAGTQPPEHASMQTIQHLGEFQVIEFRRYLTQPGGRDRFGIYFENLFPEAFEQLGAIAFGSFDERGSDDHFTWIRGFHDINARAIVNSAFYYGPLWKEHRQRMNDLLVDSDNVMLLTPLTPQDGVMLLPAVDLATEHDGAHGIIVAQIFSIEKDHVDAFAQDAREIFAHYRAAGARQAGVLVTLDVPNNFPQLPVRGDGPFLVWLGVLRDEQALKDLEAVRDAHASTLMDSDALRSPPEWVVMDPTHRSRLRWFPEWR